MSKIQFFFKDEEKEIQENDFKKFYGEKLFNDIYKKSLESMEELEKKTCKGKEFLGWLDLPEQNLVQIFKISHLLQEYDVIISIGIGGSYLGIRAIIEALHNPFETSKILFAGHHLSASYLTHLLDYLENKNFAIVVISKSGTTTEPAIAFRILFNKLIEKFGEHQIQKRVVVITDQNKGILRKLAIKYKLESEVIPDDVGGRYSVLSPVGLVPLASVGISIEEIQKGAKDTMKQIRGNTNLLQNPALVYAIYRNLNYFSNRTNEILASYRPELFYFIEWWKQLFGESEGKDYKGIYPSGNIFTTDLHSLGQYIQEGKRNIFMSLIDIEKDKELIIPYQEDDSDGLNYISGKTLNEINRIALKATRKAHQEGGIPQFTFVIPEINEYYLGSLLYLFEYACGISALTLGVNPFDQPGVETYKNNMFKLLKKPGYA